MEELTAEVFVSGISFYSDEDSLRSFFTSNFGDVVQIKMHKQDGRFKGTANVLFRNVNAATAAAAATKLSLDNRVLRVKQQTISRAPLFSKQTAINLKQGRLAFGHLGSKPNRFVVVEKQNRPMEATFEFAKRRITWELQFTTKIEIDFVDIDGDVTSALSVEGPYITIKLLRPPRLYDHDTQLSHSIGDPWRRVGMKDLLGHFGACLVHRIVFPHHEQKKIDEAINKLADYNLSRKPANSFPMPVFDVHKANIDYIKSELARLPFETLFKIESLVTHNIIPPYTATDEDSGKEWRSFVDKLVLADQAKAEGALGLLLERQNRIFDLTDQFTRCLDKVPDNLPPVADGWAMVHRMLVTPTKYYLLGPDIEVSNRVIRHYKQHLDRFLRVSFLDEGFGRIGSNEIMSKSTLDRFEALLLNGITIANRKYEFLAFSSSQLRVHSCWLFAPLPKLNCDDIRDWMGDFSGIKIVAKCAARMGQCFSTTYSTLNVSANEMKRVPDIYTHPNQPGPRYCFTDGIGKISDSFSSEVCAKLNEDPCDAFQMRLQGIKGVVARWPNMDCKLEVRDSMFKFESNHQAFEVISFARFVPAYLNRQLIQLLSHAGVPDEPFLDLQNEVIADVQNMLILPAIAQKVMVHRGVTYGTSNMVVEALDSFSIEEVFLKNLLCASAARFNLDVKTKSRIFLRDGCNLIGVIDEAGVLESGQVFVQYTDPETKYNRIVKGEVVVSKPPCLHPGDIRVLEAVDHPALHHLKNCVVFPAKGTRPHTNECSGSDLDGDRYLVIWDRRLIPPKQYPPGDYTAPKPVEVPVVTIREIILFFVNYIQNDSLGMIAHSHMAIADRESPHHKDCLKLAELHSVAVDFPKTGIPAQMLPHLKPDKYPDFMEKQTRTAYPSEKVLGRLYRQVDQPKLQLKTSWKDVQADPDLFVEGHEGYMEEAMRCKLEYNFTLRSIMFQYGIKHEAEAVSGYIMKFHKHTRDREYETTHNVREAVHKLRYHWRDEFFREFLNPDFKGQDPDSEQQKKASAWYIATYSKANKQQAEIVQNESPQTQPLDSKEMSIKGKEKEREIKAEVPVEEDFLLSFPWVVHDILCKIKNTNS